MALFGVQLVLSMIVTFFLSRLSGQISFGRWILCRNLARYIHPSDEELKKLAGISNSNKSNNKSNKRSDFQKKSKDDNFTIPKSSDIQLDPVKIRPIDLIPLQFYPDYVWFLDIGVCGLMVYLLTELYYFFLNPSKEMNLSLLWCFILMFLSLKHLFTLTRIYFRAETGGERILCLLFGFFFLIFAMAVLIIDENFLEFGLEKSYQNLSSSTKDFLVSQGFSPSFPISLTSIKITIALLCSVLGTTLTFPGIRLAKMHLDALNQYKSNNLIKFFLYLNFIFPLFISLLWVKPLARDQLVNRKDDLKILTDSQFEGLRLLVVIIFCFFRFSLVWIHLQAHLNLACERVNQLKREVGRVGALELKKLITRVYYYLCVVALQYFSPLILIFFFTLLLKIIGNFSIPNLIFNYSYPPAKFYSSPNLKFPPNDSHISSLIFSTATQFSEILTEIKNIFNFFTFYNFFSFFLWWICTSWFVSNAFGVLYHLYFNE